LFFSLGGVDEHERRQSLGLIEFASQRYNAGTKTARTNLRTRRGPRYSR
jgi:hypothetical protein